MFDELSTTLFVGDLSIRCTERDLFQLFQVFGAIESMQLKRKATANNRPTYGFVSFKHRESAEAALKYMNGHVLHGRAIRIGWAIDNPLLRRKEIMGLLPPKDKKLQTAQVHFSFITTKRSALTEELFHSVFEQFGPVLDVAIKKCQFHPENGLQTGYGFIHYPLSDRGVASALASVQYLHEKVLDSIKYSCNVSHGLENLLKVGPPSDPVTKYISAGVGSRSNSFDYASRSPSSTACIWRSPTRSSSLEDGLTSDSPGSGPLHHPTENNCFSAIQRLGSLEQLLNFSTY